MVKVIYNGDISPVNIRILASRVVGWKRGEVKDMDENGARKLLNDNKNFSLYEGEVLEEKQVEVKEIPKEDKFDLNDDGKFDNEDISLAGKVLSKSKKKKVKE